MAMVPCAGTAIAQPNVGSAGASLAELASMAALALAAIALVAGLLALARARRIAREFEGLTRSMDAAMSRIRAEAGSRVDLIASAHSDLQDRLDALHDRIGGNQPPESADGGPPKPSRAPAARPPLPVEDAGDIAAALARVVAEDALELSLQPIVSVSANAARAFEAFAHLRLASGSAVDIGRPAAQPDDFDRAAFEHQIVRRAVEVGRRRLGVRGDVMPLHCPISTAILDDAERSAAIVDLVRLDTTIAGAILLSAPSKLLVDASRARRESLEPLLAVGLSFAAEGWDDDLAKLPALRASAVVNLKVATDRLLDRGRSRRKFPPGFDLVTAAADCGIVVVATGVSTDEDAVNLLDIGVDLMAGERFGGPRRLRSRLAAEPGADLVNAG